MWSLITAKKQLFLVKMYVFGLYVKSIATIDIKKNLIYILLYLN